MEIAMNKPIQVSLSITGREILSVKDPAYLERLLGEMVKEILRDPLMPEVKSGSTYSFILRIHETDWKEIDPGQVAR